MFLTCARNTLPAEIFLQNVSVGLFALNVVCRKHAFYKSGKNFLQIVFLVSIYCEPACAGKISTHNYMQVPINLAWYLIEMSADQSHVAWYLIVMSAYQSWYLIVMSADQINLVWFLIAISADQINLVFV